MYVMYMLCYMYVKYANEYLFFTDFQEEEISVSSVSQRLWTLTFIILYRWSALFASLDQVARRPSDSIWSGKGENMDGWMNNSKWMWSDL